MRWWVPGHARQSIPRRRLAGKRTDTRRHRAGMRRLRQRVRGAPSSLKSTFKQRRNSAQTRALPGKKAPEVSRTPGAKSGDDGTQRPLPNQGSNSVSGAAVGRFLRHSTAFSPWSEAS
jgi:hypothetical protein